MSGFYISNIKRREYNNSDNRLRKSAMVDTYFVEQDTNTKFLDDKIFYDSERYFAIIEGYVLNKKEFCERCGKNWADTVIEMAGKPHFYDEFRGAFSGALYDKQEKLWLAYTSHIGDRPIYYYCYNGVFVISSEVQWIVDALKDNGIDITIEEDAVWDMLTYAFMTSDNTYVQGIKRLPYGCALTWGGISRSRKVL